MTRMIETNSGRIAPPRDMRLTVDRGSDGKPDAVNKSDTEIINTTLSQVVARLNGGVSIGRAANGERAGNLDAQYLDLTFTGAGSTKFRHGLDRIPVGYLIVGSDADVRVYDYEKLSWSKLVMGLQATGAANIRILIW